MPPKIKSQTPVSPEFVKTMLNMYATWLQLNSSMIMEGRNTIAQRMRMTAQRFLPIIRRQSPGPRQGYEYELTRLRRMPYSSFTVEVNIDPSRNHQDQPWPTIPWLVGRTHHITMTDYRNRGRVMGEMGCYDVYIPSSIIAHPDMSHIHMIPLRNPQSFRRHPHHGIVSSSSFHPDNPLSFRTTNCYGTYSGVIKGLIDDPDIPELFRQLHNHLCTYGDRPPFELRMDFPINIKEDE